MVKELQHTAPLGKSHHQGLHFQNMCYLEAQVSGNKRYAYAKGDYNSLCEKIKAHDWEEEMRGMSANEARHHVESTLMEAMSKMIPRRRWNRNHLKRKPLWMNEKALAKVKKKGQAYR